MNSTYDTIVNTDIDWASRSPVFNYTTESLPLIYFSIAWGSVLFLHSIYLHRFKYTLVRIVSEVASLSLIFEATCFYQCVDGSCSVLQQAIIYNVIGNSIFGLILQICDNFLTFQRYQVVVGKASTLHKVLAFTWWFVLMVVTWWPFFWLAPIWYDQNSEEWLFIQLVVAGWIDFGAFVMFNIFYLVLVVRELAKMSRTVSSTVRVTHNSQYLTGVGIRALFHTVLSTAGILLYVVNLPDGVLEQNILIAGSIHLFLNFRFKLDDIFKKVTASIPVHVRWHSTIPAAPDQVEQRTASEPYPEGFYS